MADKILEAQSPFFSNKTQIDFIIKHISALKKHLSSIYDMQEISNI